MRRSEHRFQVTSAAFRFALVLDAQRWTGVAYPYGLRSATIKLLKRIGEHSRWYSRPLPVWTVRVYGMTHRFNRYMTSYMLAAMMHEHHVNVKGTRHFWCLYCNPARGGTVETIGALEAADDFLSVIPYE